MDSCPNSTLEADDRPEAHWDSLPVSSVAPWDIAAVALPKKASADIHAAMEECSEQVAAVMWAGNSNAGWDLVWGNHLGGGNLMREVGPVAVAAVVGRLSTVLSSADIQPAAVDSIPEKRHPSDDCRTSAAVRHSHLGSHSGPDPVA